MNNKPSQLGETLNHETELSRDAIHVAIAPLIAGESLEPGCSIKLKYGTDDIALSAYYSHPYLGETEFSHGEIIGVADPFLRKTITKGTIFWCLLNPGTITGLKHQWSHPAFDVAPIEVANQPEHITWLHRFAEKYEFDYDNMISRAIEGSDICAGSDFSRSHFEPGEEEKFWEMIQAHVGENFDDQHRKETGWSCAC